MAYSCKLLFLSSSYCIRVFVLFSLVLELIPKWALMPHFVDTRIGGQDAQTWMIVWMPEFFAGSGEGLGAYVTFMLHFLAPWACCGWLGSCYQDHGWCFILALPIILVLQAYMAMAEGSHLTASWFPGHSVYSLSLSFLLPPLWSSWPYQCMAHWWCFVFCVGIVNAGAEAGRDCVIYDVSGSSTVVGNWWYTCIAYWYGHDDMIWWCTTIK